MFHGCGRSLCGEDGRRLQRIHVVLVVAFRREALAARLLHGPFHDVGLGLVSRGFRRGALRLALLGAFLEHCYRCAFARSGRRAALPDLWVLRRGGAALRLGRLQWWLGRAAAVLAAIGTPQRLRFTRCAASSCLLVSHDTLACCCRDRVDKGAWSRPKRAKESRWSTSYRRAAFAHFYRAKNTGAVSPGCRAAQHRHCWMRHVCWALLATTTMALLKPPTPGECFCGKTRISLITPSDCRRASAIARSAGGLQRAVLREFIDAAQQRANDIYGFPPSSFWRASRPANVVRYRCRRARNPAGDLKQASGPSRPWQRSRDRIREAVAAHPLFGWVWTCMTA